MLRWLDVDFNAIGWERPGMLSAWSASRFPNGTHVICADDESNLCKGIVRNAKPGYGRGFILDIELDLSSWTDGDDIRQQ